MYFIFILIIFLFLFEGYFLYTKKHWKEIGIISIILSLAFLFTLSQNQILPEIDITGPMEALFKPITDLVGEFQ